MALLIEQVCVSNLLNAKLFHLKQAEYLACLSFLKYSKI